LSDLSLLNSHQKRRLDGIPTISVLIGSIGLSIYYWKDWLNKEQRTSCIVSNLDLKQILELWIEKIHDQKHLFQRCVDYIAQKTNSNNYDNIAYQLRNRTKHELNIFYSNIFKNQTHYDVNLLFENIINQERLKPYSINISKLTHIWGCKPKSFFNLLHSISEMIPSDELPAIIIPIKILCSNNESLNNIEKSARILEKISSHLCFLPVALALNETDYNKFIAQAPDSRVKALCQETTIQVKGLDFTNAKQMLNSIPETSNSIVSKVVKVLVNEGTTEKLIQDFKKIVLTSLSPDLKNVKQTNNARSNVEKFFFHLLETLSETTGLFELNGKLDFKFGNKLMEVDFVSKKYKIAIEIDGYYHFTSKEAYRRDRRKDWILQKKGYIVLRILADDIVCKLEEIIKEIKEIIQIQKSKQENNYL